MRKLFISAGLTLILAGCATQAVISDLETDKVKVVASGNDGTVIMAAARKGCAVHKRTPVSISRRCLDNYCINVEYLFACVQ